MSKFTGLFTFDNDSHKYVPIAQAKDILDLKDYEEPKEYWFINTVNAVGLHTRTNGLTDSENSYIEGCQLAIGNYFKTKKEAEKAVEKLKAWKRLKDKGFRFRGWNIADDGKGITIFANYPSGTGEDLDLLCGGEE